MDVSRETPDVTTKPKCHDLTNMLVCVFHDTHLPSLARVRDVHPPWSWKPQRPIEVGDPKVINQVEGIMLYFLALHRLGDQFAILSFNGLSNIATHVFRMLR